jgi:hypothetical protein
MVAVEEDLGYAFSAIDGRACILGLFEESVRKGFLCGCFCAAPKYAWEETCDAINHNSCRKRSIGENIITDTEKLICKCFKDPFVNAFIMATNEEEMFFSRKTLCRRLTERLSLRGHHDDACIRLAEAFDGLKERLGLHKHPGSTAVGFVIDRSPGVMRKIAQIHHADVDSAPGNRSA